MTDAEEAAVRDEYEKWAATRVPVSRAAEGEAACGKQCPCGSDCLRPVGHEGSAEPGAPLHLCVGDYDNVPGTCPA